MAAQHSFLTGSHVSSSKGVRSSITPLRGDARRLDHEPGILCDLIHRLAFLLSSFSFKEKKEKGKERRILSTYPHMKGKKTTFI